MKCNQNKYAYSKRGTTKTRAAANQAVQAKNQPDQTKCLSRQDIVASNNNDSLSELMKKVPYEKIDTESNLLMVTILFMCI